MQTPSFIVISFSSKILEHKWRENVLKVKNSTGFNIMINDFADLWAKLKSKRLAINAVYPNVYTYTMCLRLKRKKKKITKRIHAHFQSRQRVSSYLLKIKHSS